ncbi:MAG TPA: GerMN domain-containing protein [Candidatus Saccharimonadales bacterium]|nr:GerMN domain-containing protein [Candidatus Saccharimonadales bacterium]
MTGDAQAHRALPPAHRAQRLVIAGSVLVAAVLVLLGTWLFSPRPAAHPPREKVVEPPPQSVQVELFFGSPQGEGLARESRVVSLPENLSERMRVLVNELAAGSTAGGQSLLPAAATLRAVYLVQNGETLCLDFSRDLKAGLNAGSTNEYLVLGSLVETVRANVPGVKRVQVLLEGQIVESLGGHYDLSRPLDLEEWKEGSDAAAP